MHTTYLQNKIGTLYRCAARSLSRRVLLVSRTPWQNHTAQVLLCVWIGLRTVDAVSKLTLKVLRTECLRTWLLSCPVAWERDSKLRWLPQGDVFKPISRSGNDISRTTVPTDEAFVYQDNSFTWLETTWMNGVWFSAGSVIFLFAGVLLTYPLDARSSLLWSKTAEPPSW
jgi:hypothetical protein